MITRCIACRKNAIVKDMVWIEPLSETDSTPMYLRGLICQDCAVVHWAWEFDETTDLTDIGGLAHDNNP